MLTILIIYVVGIILAYIFIGYINDTEIGPDIPFAYIFFSLPLVCLMLFFFIIERISNISPPSLKRKKNKS